MFIKTAGWFLGLAGWVAAETFPHSEVKVMGPVEYGQPTKKTRYTGRPKYQAFEFNARPGDRLEISLTGSGAKPTAFLANSAFESLAGGQDHFSATIPANSKAASYYVVIEGREGRPATYILRVERPSR